MAGRLVAFLSQREPELLERWLHALRRNAVGAALSREELEDRLRSYLRQLLEALSATETAAPPAEEVLAPTRRLAAEHGEQRLELGYDAAAVVRDYACLRDVLVQSMADAGVEPEPDELWRLMAFLMDGVQAAVHTYSLERDAKVRAASAKHVGFLVHELRQPLQSLRLRADLLARREGPVSVADVAVIRRAVEALSERVEESLLESRLDGLEQLFVEPLEPATLLGEVEADAAPLAEAKGITLRTQMPREPAMLEADRRLLRSALSNLAHNAVKFSPAGGEVELRAVVTSTGHLVFEVQDACGGLAEGAVDKMFSPFVQLGQDRSGFGLGLALARRVADAHGGALRVHDLPGRGCVFALELPLRRAETLQ